MIALVSTMRNRYLLAGIMIGLLLIIAVSAQTDTSSAGTGAPQLQDQTKDKDGIFKESQSSPRTRR